MSLNTRGFTLLEMLIAMMIGSMVMLGAARLLPLLQQQNLRLQLQVQLDDELAQMIQTVDKLVRRAGYCHGQCGEGAIRIDNAGRCLLVRWDENSNGRWEGPEREESEYYGFRLRAGNLEMQRGVERCDSAGWEKLNDPRVMVLDDFQVTRKRQRIGMVFEGRTRLQSGITRRIEHGLIAENL